MMFKILTLSLIVAGSPVSQAFIASGCSHSVSSTQLYSQAAKDFVNRARATAGMPPEEDTPQLFSDQLLQDMQECLLLLEHRVKEGPGCLTHREIDDFAIAAEHVLVDMKQQGATLPRRIKPGERQARAEAAAAAAASAAEKEGKSPQEIESIAKEAYNAAQKDMIPPPPESPSAQTTTSLQRTVTDTSDDEGPAYDGTGGFGLAKGTANTYLIDGMDEMTPEEYQQALTRKVSERAYQRRYGMGGRHGNQQTLDYMQSLSRGRDTNPFAKGSMEG